MKTVSEIATDKLAVSADEVERWIRSEGAKQDQARAHRSGKPVAAASETAYVSAAGMGMAVPREAEHGAAGDENWRSRGVHGSLIERYALIL